MPDKQKGKRRRDNDIVKNVCKRKSRLTDFRNVLTVYGKMLFNHVVIALKFRDSKLIKLEVL